MKFKIFLLITILFSPTGLFAQNVHPKLVLTKQAVQEIKSALGTAQLFDKSFNEAKKIADDAIAGPKDVPLPKDPGGGYTHEKHKQNYNEMYFSGILFQVTGEEKYAFFIKELLDRYAEIYPELKNHPQSKEQAPGRLFWQSLNETVWLLHTIQAYDCIYDWLSPEDRKNYEERIFLPMTKFFVEETEHEFNLIHNHGTWMVACVGMTGMVLGNQDLIDKSLYGSMKKGDGGFLQQLELLFSPDGYYTEGGYYVRYALWPFFIFAESIHNTLPEIKIYDYRDQILKKAFYSALQVTYTNGAFMPINDALKEKTFLSTELIFALNFVYHHYGADKELLSIAKKQGSVSLTGGGIKVAKDINSEKEIPNFTWKSVEYKDGAEGKEGGISIMRWGDVDDQAALLFKYGSHGLSHGHFDKLQFLFYDQGTEIIQDYGAARFLNVEQKAGGRYLPENKSFAMQTIAHNTVIVDEQSHFGGQREISEKNHAEKYFVNLDDKDFQVASAKAVNVYDGVSFHRTIAMIKDENFNRPIAIDLFRINSNEEHQYDLPFYYMGHFIYSNFKYTPFVKERTTMGEKNGYEHLWKTAEADPEGTSTFTWLNGERYYSVTSNSDASTEIFFTQIGANDPNFNLRNEQAVMFRKKAKDHVFVSVIEPHGEFNPTLESSFNSYSAIEEIKILFSDENYTAAEIKGKNNLSWIFAVANNNADDKSEHKLTLNGKLYSWVGPVKLFKDSIK